MPPSPLGWYYGLKVANGSTCLQLEEYKTLLKGTAEKLPLHISFRRAACMHTLYFKVGTGEAKNLSVENVLMQPLDNSFPV